ncbi:MAG: hypothetical protein QG652_885 [Pseudomonadota bacterium]|nr:hypothetical protein [Pseudomonadota bacterium]
MNKKRQNDTSQTTPRQQRCYSVNGLWYFELRGGGQHGPYDSKQEMENALNEFIALHEEIKTRE